MDDGQKGTEINGVQYVAQVRQDDGLWKDAATAANFDALREQAR